MNCYCGDLLVAHTWVNPVNAEQEIGRCAMCKCRKYEKEASASVELNTRELKEISNILQMERYRSMEFGPGSCLAQKIEKTLARLERENQS